MVKSYMCWLTFLLGVLCGGYVVGCFASMKIKGLKDLIEFKNSMIHRLQEIIRKK